MHPLTKATLAHLLAALLTLLLTRAYALFARGAASPCMTLLPLLPLLAGVLPFLLLRLLLPRITRPPAWRLFLNLWNSALATLATGMFLTGILDIAGSSSPLLPLFPIVALSLALLSLPPFLVAWQHA